MKTISEIKAYLDALKAKGYRFTKQGILPPLGQPEIICIDYINIIKYEDYK